MLQDHGAHVAVGANGCRPINFLAGKDASGRALKPRLVGGETMNAELDETEQREHMLKTADQLGVPVSSYG